MNKENLGSSLAKASLDDIPTPKNDAKDIYWTCKGKW